MEHNDFVIIGCPNCGETENVHPNVDFSKEKSSISEFLCNECGLFFEPATIIEQN